MNDQKLKTLVTFCAGVGLLIMLAVMASSNLPIIPDSLKVALKQPSSQTAAAWEAVYPSYGGWPAWHTCNGFSNVCPNGAWYSFLPSYADIYLTSSPAQKVISTVSLSPNLGWGARYYTAVSYSGSIPTVPAGTSLTLEWACQDYQTSYFGGAGCNNYDAFGNCIGWYGVSGSQSFLDYSSASVNGVTQPPLGSMVVQPANTTTYSVQCVHNPSGQVVGYGYPLPDTPLMSFTVDVIPGPPPPPPSLPILTIKGNGTNPTSVVLGTSVNVAATFTPDSGDTLTKTAINDSDGNAWCGTGCTPAPPGNPTEWTNPPLNLKSHTFTATAPGIYKFSPAAQTSVHPTPWYDGGQELLVTVTCPIGTHDETGVCVPDPTCANGTGPVGACTSCDPGFILDGSGACVPECINGTGPAGACTSCDLGFHPDGGQCLPDLTCPGPHEDPANSCSCFSPYVKVSGVCSIRPTISSFFADQPRVRANSVASLNWTVTGLVAGEGISCSISSNPVGVFSQSMPANTAPTWSGSHVTTNPITRSTTFTLSCTNAPSKPITVGIVPGVIEI